jgi:flavin reductase (DIM6/NTAB) family NADH-FMN oxidoreductase RutF
MAGFKEISPAELKENPFHLIGTDWMLVCAEKPDGRANAMTASWGGLGVMWGQNVAYTVIRPQRFTKEFVDEAETYSLNFFDGQRQMLNYMGTVSGRDEDKIKNTSLNVLHEGRTSYFEQAKTVLICKKLYAQEFKPECFIAKELDGKWYSGDYHTMYISEIKKVLVKE